MADEPSPAQLRALVDMGSNGIRFSISDLSPATARIMPTLFQDRAGISLYDAQYSTGTKQAIPKDTTDQVLSAFAKFERVCEDFSIPPQNIRVVATEATREAINSVEFRAAIKQCVGWEVEMLPKEEEGRVGAMGIASSFAHVNGLVMDLGGGSTQMSWMSTNDGEVDVQGSVSLPYGAAALMRRLGDAKDDEQRLAAFEDEVRSRLRAAFESVTGKSSKETRDMAPFPVFLSGGGFRGWGHLLMDQHALSPYPIPIINGFSVSPTSFSDTPSVQAQITGKATADANAKVFRISERREQQVPAIAFLIAALTSVLPAKVTEMRFAQGGVREGLLFSSLSAATRAQSPLLVATSAHGSASRDAILRTLDPLTRLCPPRMRALIAPFVNLMFAHRSYPKEAQAAAGLHVATTGFLAGVHGLAHEERAVLGLLLCERWGGEVAPTDEDFRRRLQKLAGAEVSWWCRLVGRVGALLGAVYPAGRVAEPRVEFGASLERPGVLLDVRWAADLDGREFTKEVGDVEKVGKKKNRIGGRDGWGLKVEVFEGRM